MNIFKRPAGYKEALTIYRAYSPFRLFFTSKWRQLKDEWLS